LQDNDPVLIPPSRTASAQSGLTEGIRYAAFDLDGTILEQTGFIDDRLLIQISRLRLDGIYSSIVTGRSLRSFLSLGLRAAILSQFEPEVLLYNGNAVFHPSTETFEVRNRIPIHVPALLRNMGINEIVVDQGAHLVASNAKSALMYSMIYGLPRSEIRIGYSSDLELTTALEMTVFPSGKEIDPLVTEEMLEVRRIGYLDAVAVQPAGTCKAVALARHLRNQPSRVGLGNVVAFGDGYNDGCMINSAAFGVAMRQSDEVASGNCDIQLLVPLHEFLASRQFNQVMTAGARSTASHGECDGRHRNHRYVLSGQPLC
jgi:HAD superfamily hydrolase (TIGR01484 family)